LPFPVAGLPRATLAPIGIEHPFGRSRVPGQGFGGPPWTRNQFAATIGTPAGQHAFRAVATVRALERADHRFGRFRRKITIAALATGTKLKHVATSLKSHILWDHDGVLVDTEPWYFEATRQCIAVLGVDLRKPDYLRDMAAGRPAWERARALGASERQVADARRDRDALYQQFLREKDIDIPGVVEVLAELAGRFSMAIVTTAKRQDFELIHKDRSILQFMEFVIANGDYVHSKPHPEPYLTALLRFDIDARHALAIEDSERGLRAAVAAGIDCIVIDNAFVDGQDFSLATQRVASIKDLAPSLCGIPRS
jgi:HAD superfamily hydrolase (TIGR01509 family)